MPIFENCLRCGNTYQVHGGQMFCSLRCRKAYHRVPEKSCPTCGKTFQPRGNQIYCTVEHRKYSQEVINDTEN